MNIQPSNNQIKHAISYTAYTHSHAEATLASRCDVVISDDVGVVKPIIEGKGVSLGNRNRRFLMGNGGLEEGSGGADEGKKEDREEGTSHGYQVHRNEILC